MNTNVKDEANVINQQAQANEEFTPITKLKLFDGVILSKLTGTLIRKIKKDSKGYWCKYTYNAAGKLLTCEDSDGYWSKFSYNAAGQILTYENSDGKWYKRTYNATGQILTYEDSDGIFHQYIAHDGVYGLRFEEGRYKAGCREFSYEEAIQHWTERATDEEDEISNRAKLFLKAIAEHQLMLNQSNTRQFH